MGSQVISLIGVTVDTNWGLGGPCDPKQSGLSREKIVAATTAGYAHHNGVESPYEVAAMDDAAKVPVTVLTGFLGSGKTTLLNHILTQQHGKKICVIENEFGEVGIDDKLLAKNTAMQAEEEIIEMMNGCICCTVRGDLIRILNNLARRRDKFDRIVLETTGLADPGPVAQTFFVDDDTVVACSISTA